jgi:hypothetical protein
MKETTKIAAVLLVPTDGDPHGLLEEGPCEARPPAVWQDPRNTHGHHHEWHAGLMHSARGDRRALVLAWENKLVSEGINRFCLRALDRPDDYNVHVWVTDLLCGDDDARVDTYGLGTIVLLDADGNEVAPEAAR